MMIRSFAELIVIDAVRLDGSKWQVDVLSVELGPTVGILRMDMLQQLIDSDVWGEVLRVRAQDIKQLLVNRMLTWRSVFGKLIFAGVGVEEAGAGLLHLWSKRVLTVIHIVFIVI